jgi:hypothetical protein
LTCPLLSSDERKIVLIVSIKDFKHCFSGENGSKYSGNSSSGKKNINWQSSNPKYVISSQQNPEEKEGSYEFINICH